MYLQRTAADRTVSNQLYKRLIETIGKDPTIAEKNLFYANYGSIRLFLEGLVGYGQKLWQLLNIFTASSAERAALIKWFTPTLFDGIIGGAIVTGITVWAILSNSEIDDD